MDQRQQSTDFELPRHLPPGQIGSIDAPIYASFTSRFGHAYPKPRFLRSELGSTAVYEVPPPSGQSKRQILLIHGACTPAIGMWPLTKELQALDENAHIVFYDLWGHGLSSTPLSAHDPHIFHLQIFQVLSFMRWTRAHIIGFSFGGVTAMSFTIQNPWIASSVSVLGTAGLLQKSTFTQEMQILLDSQGREVEARDHILSWLEGGPLVVPPDWQEQVKSGKVVAEALREWELQEHRGHAHSVLSMFREGGVHDREDLVHDFVRLDVPKLGIVGEVDPVCSEVQLVDLGFQDVRVVEKGDHSFVRSNPSQVARFLNDFWTQHVDETK